jgi:type I restriction enzyme S subunit
METTMALNKTKQALVPKLRFREFEDEWRFDELGNISKVSSGGTPNRNIDAFWNGDIPWITTSLINFNIINTSEEYITKEAVFNSSAKLFPKGAILIAMYGQGKTRGKVAILGIEATTNQACGVVIPYNDLDYIYLFQNLAGRYDEIRSLSNEGGQQNLSGGILKSIKIQFPSLLEQQKIASFLSAVDEKIQQLSRKKELLEQYKKGVIQQLFSGKLRFKDENGMEYPDWKLRKMNEVLFEHKLNSTGKEEVFSVSVHKGLINQIEHLGRVFAAKNTDNYNLVKPGDIVYTKSPTGSFPLGIIKQSKVNKDVIVSPLYGIFTPETHGLGYMLNVYFESPINVNNYLASIIQKGAKNTINITNTTFLSKKMKLPVSKEEQNKIGNFLEQIDSKIESTTQQITQTQTFKKGLLQKMFV